MHQRDDLHSGDVSCHERGITLLEVMIAVAVVVLGFLALAQTIVTTHALKRNSDERRAVLSAVRVVAEEVRSVSDEARTDEATWARNIVSAVQSGGRLGTNFTVDGLVPRPGDTTVGTLQVVTDETTTDVDLGVDLGMPRDLDGDGGVASRDVATDASMLPVVLTLRWRGLMGDREIRRGFYVTRF